MIYQCETKGLNKRVELIWFLICLSCKPASKIQYSQNGISLLYINKNMSLCKHTCDFVPIFLLQLHLTYEYESKVQLEVTGMKGQMCDVERIFDSYVTLRWRLNFDPYLWSGTACFVCRNNLFHAQREPPIITEFLQTLECNNF